MCCIPSWRTHRSASIVAKNRTASFVGHVPKHFGKWFYPSDWLVGVYLFPELFGYTDPIADVERNLSLNWKECLPFVLMLKWESMDIENIYSIFAIFPLPSSILLCVNMVSCRRLARLYITDITTRHIPLYC